jgi:hypothetical protein
LRRVFAGIFLIALSTLMLELLFIRVFEVILNPYYAYMIITCVMFCFGLAGVYSCLKPFQISAEVRPYLSRLSFLFAVSAIATLPIMNHVPFDFYEIPKSPLLQTSYFLGMYFALALPIFFAGLIITTLLSVYANKIQSLYFWDLTGAALGCVILIPFLPKIGPGGLLFCAGAFGVWTSGILSKNKIWLHISAIVGIVLVIIPFYRSDGYFDFHEHRAKRGVKEAKKSGKAGLTYWDPVSKIDVIDQTVKKHIAYDGGAQSSHIFPFDGNYQKLRNTLPDSVSNHFGEDKCLLRTFSNEIQTRKCSLLAVQEVRRQKQRSCMAQAMWMPSRW